ncbi:MAG: UMP kinase [archaeon]|nr:UMP kinase [archaeon]MDA0842911.1 UMP kinase [archaeon]MDA1168092.1 UMP kinase [archaeon]
MGEIQVIALGGSLLRPDSEHDRNDWIDNILSILTQGVEKGMKFVLIIGGGAPAREYISIAQRFVSSAHRLDTIGIAATRLNATLLQQIFLSHGLNVSSSIPIVISELEHALKDCDIVVMGGTQPGQTTDTVAVEAACFIQARHCLIATNVSHVFTKDPRHHSDAQPISSLRLYELLELSGEALEPGASTVVDPVAIKKAIDGQMKLLVVDGRDTMRIQAAITGLEFEGTVVQP